MTMPGDRLFPHDVTKEAGVRLMLEQRKPVSGSMSGSRPATKELPLATKSTQMFPKNVGKIGTIVEKEWKNIGDRMTFRHTSETPERGTITCSVLPTQGTFTGEIEG